MSILSSNNASYLQKEIEQEDLIRFGFIQDKRNDVFIDFVDAYGNVLSSEHSIPSGEECYRLYKLSIRNGVGGLYEGSILPNVKSLIDLHFYSKMLKGSDKSQKIVEDNIFHLKFSKMMEDNIFNLKFSDLREDLF